MKVLVITPLDEASEYVTMNMMNQLTKAGFNALAVPAFINYLVETHLANNYEEGICKALISAREFAAATDDCIILGNCIKSSNIKFDIIIEMNVNHEEGAKQADVQIAAMKKKYARDISILPLLHVYTTDDAEYTAGGETTEVVQLIKNLWNSTVKQNLVMNSVAS